MKPLESILRTPADVADWSDAAALQKRMVLAVENLSSMAVDCGRARQVREYDSDRRKRALSRAMAAPLAGGESAAKSEAEARNSESYSKELNQLAAEYEAAEAVLIEFDVKKLEWSTCQSLLAMEREAVKRI